MERLSGRIVRQIVRSRVERLVAVGRPGTGCQVSHQLTFVPPADVAAPRTDQPWLAVSLHRFLGGGRRRCLVGSPRSFLLLKFPLLVRISVPASRNIIVMLPS